MIAKSYILYNLKYIDNKFKKTVNPKETLLLSKLAIIELCGWIEESMDDMVRRASKKCKFNSTNQTHVEAIIRRNYGFEYKDNFRNMLVQVLGLVNIEKLESSYDNSIIDRMKSVLGSLKISRDIEAHTHIKGITRRINAPSVTINQFPDVYNGLIEIDKKLKRIRY